MRVFPAALAHNTLRDLAIVPLATAHSTTAAQLQKFKLSQQYQALALAVKEAPQITATLQLLNKKDMPQD